MNGRSAPTVLITRPKAAALPLKQMLEAKGYATIVEPLLVIEQLGSMQALPERVQALALTSAHAVPGLSEDAKRLPVFTVGKATAEAARAAGCGQVISGDGDASALAALIARRCRPDDGVILHVSGDVVREELRQELGEQGFDVHQDVVYRALASESFSGDLQRALRGHDVAAVLLFSPRTADILVRLLIETGLSRYVDRTTAICVSGATATPCRTLDWRAIVLAARPNQQALLKALEGSIRIC